MMAEKVVASKRRLCAARFSRERGYFLSSCRKRQLVLVGSFVCFLPIVGIIFGKISLLNLKLKRLTSSSGGCIDEFNSFFTTMTPRIDTIVSFMVKLYVLSPTTC